MWGWSEVEQGSLPDFSAMLSAVCLPYAVTKIDSWEDRPKHSKHAVQSHWHFDFAMPRCGALLQNYDL
jgi:hypothetical protein